MPHFDDLARLNTLFSDVVSANRFKKWKAEIVRDTGTNLSQYAFGQIFWKKSLGRPNTATLSEGIVVEAWRDEMHLVGAIGGAAHWEVLRVPCVPSWWDGKDDGKYWRVPYMVPNLTEGASNDGLPEHSTYTHIVPHLKPSTAWTVPGGRFGIGSAGLRAFEPPGVAFIKQKGPVYFPFEIVLKSLFISP